MKPIFLSVLCFTMFIAPARAVIDTNSNGLSDLWEKLFNNGQLFPSNFDPQADPDGDGWKNVQEATAGTDPFDANPPGGFLIPLVATIPAVYEPADPADPNADLGILQLARHAFTWDTKMGKTYQVIASTDLSPGSWIAASEIYMGSGSEFTYELEPVNTDGTIPEKLFWRVKIDDTDSDSDNLNDWEESELTLDPFSPDTDQDGIRDDVDTQPKNSATFADPDGRGLQAAGLMTGLVANWRFEDSTIPVATLFGKNEARCENHAPATSPAWPVLVPFVTNGIPPFERRGFVSRGLPLPTKSIFGDGKVFNGITASFTLSFWHRFEKDSIKNGNSIHKCLWSLVNSKPQSSSVESNTLSVRKKSATEEEFYLGAYTWNNNGGNPSSTIPGKKFTRPLGTADDGKWHQYTIVRTGGKYTLYIDGQIMSGLDNSSVTWLTIPFSDPTPTTYGDYNYVWNTFGRMSPNLAHNQTLGTFDRIRLWSRPLDLTDATTLYHEDLDGDGLWDVSENNTEVWNDINRNSVREDGEYQFRSSPLLWENTDRDTDGDGLSDLDEQNLYHTDIAHPDTDGDLLPDGWEIEHNLDPLVSTGEDGQTGDPDGDGLDNLGEFSYISDPNKKDTDGDGIEDGPEAANGSNPSDDRDNGQQISPEKRVDIKLGIGDQSTSKSEDYNINIFSIDPDTGAEIPFHTFRSGGHGAYEEKTRQIFHKGETYTFQIDWQSSTQGSQNYEPAAPPNGPDYDYTLKVEPQGDYLGKFFPSWDSLTGAVDPNNPLPSVKANDVATSQQQFEETYENRRVAIVAPKLEWKAFEGYDNVEPHIDPWSTTGEQKGQRIFPGRANPRGEITQHKLNLIATGGLKGIDCYVRAFDIDDSTDEAFDIEPFATQPVIDTNGKGGLDNRLDFLGTEFNGHFWNKGAWADSEIVKMFDESGRAKFDFRVGMQPGNNYRVVASVGDYLGYADVQVFDVSAETYLGPEVQDDGNSISSAPLTVWRRLWVENDSMSKVRLDQYNRKRNDLNSDLDTPVIRDVNTDSNNGVFEIEIESVSDISSFDFLQNERFKVGGNIYDIIATRSIPEGLNQVSQSFVTLASPEPSITTTSGYRLWDDDDFGLIADPLPRTDLIADDIVKNVYKPSFIEVVDVNSYGEVYNRDKEVDFFRNHPVIVGSFLNPNPGVWDDAINLHGNRSVWVANVIAGYQAEVIADKDPSHEDSDEGLTPGKSVYYNGAAKYSVVYVEAVRDGLDAELRDSTNDSVALNNEIDIRIKLTVAHEIGHHPKYSLGDLHHDEFGLMQGGGYAGFGNTDDAKFSPLTVLRFRGVSNWQEE